MQSAYLFVVVIPFVAQTSHEFTRGVNLFVSPAAAAGPVHRSGRNLCASGQTSLCPSVHSTQQVLCSRKCSSTRNIPYEPRPPVKHRRHLYQGRGTQYGHYRIDRTTLCPQEPRESIKRTDWDSKFRNFSAEPPPPTK
eukprot:scpid73396/ scgid26860/ 